MSPSSFPHLSGSSTSSSPLSNQDEIIDLDQGFEQVKNEGILPFIKCIEDQQREFFKAKRFVSLYDLIFKMCIQREPYNWSEAMYERYTGAISEYLTSTVVPALQRARGQFDIAFLREWKTRWNNQKLIVQGLAKLFMYLDRFYTPNTDGIHPLREQGFKLYKEAVFDQFESFARSAILNAIEKERNHEEQDRLLLQEAVAVFVEMGFNFGNKKLTVYNNELERHIVEHAGAFYRRKSREWMDEDSCPVYLEKCERILIAERNRVEAYLNRCTLEPLSRECYSKLLKTHQRDLLSKKTGLFHLLSINAVDDLSRLYRLFKPYENDLEPISELFLDHIKAAGSEVVDKAKPEAAGQAADANHALVRNLIALHAQYNEVVVHCFEKHSIMQKALKKAFEEFINKDNRVSKLLAKFVNDVLKKGSKVNVKDIDSTLDNVVFLYGYIQEKDVFERDYQIFLSNRLLQGLCESEHSEKSMIAKLKTEYVQTANEIFSIPCN
jgi:cullin 1